MLPASHFHKGSLKVSEGFGLQARILRAVCTPNTAPLGENALGDASRRSQNGGFRSLVENNAPPSFHGAGAHSKLRISFRAAQPQRPLGSSEAFQCISFGHKFMKWR